MQLSIDFTQFIDLLKIKTVENKKMIWDEIRKKWYILQPEEFVRQLVVKYLIHELGYNKNKIQLEKKILINGLEKRFDILVYDQDFQPYLLIECKSSSTPLQQKVFDQIAFYNIALKVPYLWVTNGPDSYCCKIDIMAKNYTFLKQLPKADSQ